MKSIVARQIIVRSLPVELYARTDAPVPCGSHADRQKSGQLYQPDFIFRAQFRVAKKLLARSGAQVISGKARALRLTNCR